MEWLTVNEAVAKTGKGERTIRRWAKSHDTNGFAVRKQGKIIMINASILAEDYPIKDVRQNAANDINHDKTSQMHIVSNTETIKQLSEHLRNRDNEIKILLNHKNLTALWLILGFITIIGCLYYAFLNYKNEITVNKAIEIEAISKGYQKQIETNQKNNSQLILNQQQIIAQQHQELAKKDRLISELYNDTKEQNKKLLELTESHKKRSHKK